MSPDLAAVPTCDHAFSRHARPRSPVSVRACQLCHVIDFADLDSQVAAVIGRYARTPRSQMDPLVKRQRGDGDVA